MELIRFLWKLISESRYFTVSIQEQDTDKIVIQVSCSVHCQRNESDWVRSIQLDVPIVPDFTSDCFL